MAAILFEAGGNGAAGAWAIGKGMKSCEGFIGGECSSVTEMAAKGLGIGVA